MHGRPKKEGVACDHKFLSSGTLKKEAWPMCFSVRVKGVWFQCMSDPANKAWPLSLLFLEKVSVYHILIGVACVRVSPSEKSRSLHAY